MTQQFHEGQKVEITRTKIGVKTWHKATITHLAAASCTGGYHDMPARYAVQFPDGTRAVFDAEHIR